MKLSVIVPVYNQEKHVAKCLSSLLEQGLSEDDYEVIVVDDASTDKSLDICKSYANTRDINIKIIHKAKNQGVECARWTGYQASRGVFITYVDSDDWLKKGTLLKMVNKIEETGCDYVECGFVRSMGRHFKFNKIVKPALTGLIQIPELWDKYYISFFGVNVLNVNMWGKVYRKSTLEKAKLEPLGLTMGEDLAYNLRLFPYLQKIYIMDEVGYNYRWGGMTSKYNPHLYPDLKRLYRLKSDIAKRNNYTKAFDYLKIELKNVFYSDIIQQIEYKAGDEEEIKASISNELSDEIWNDALKVENHPSFYQQEFVKALQKRDVDNIYKICLVACKQKRGLRRMKTFANFVLNL